MQNPSEKACKTGRTMYVFQAAFEYLISILVSGSFLATLTKSIGISDSLTGIISSFVSLGCLFQLLSVFIRGKRMKPIVVAMSVLNQLLFIALYIIPLSGLGSTVKTVVFAVAIMAAYIVYNMVHPKKINWFMSLVDDHKRGEFTAKKEAVSLLAGMAFQFIMGAVVDYFAEVGKIKTAFIVSAVVMLSLSVLHTVCMLISVEKEVVINRKLSVIGTVRDVLANKSLLKVVVVFILYYGFNYMSVSYYGVFMINDLGFSLTYTSFLAIFSSVSRIAFSFFWGRFADRNSFSRMIERCLGVLALSFLMFALATPVTGKIMALLYYFFHGIALGGINSAIINLVYDYVEPEKRSDSLAICQAASGVVGFLSVLAASPFVSFMQANGNSVFGITVYAQQILSAISTLGCVAAIIYVRLVLGKRKNNN